MTGLAGDFASAARTLRRHPGRSALVALTMALGIGLTTAIFTVVHGVLLNPLPWPNASRLVRLSETRDGATRHWPWRITSRTYHSWAENAATVEGLAAWQGCASSTLTEAGEPMRVGCSSVTASLFSLLEAQTVAGSFFTASDERSGGVLLLAEGLWEERFDRSSDAIGRVVRLGGNPHRIVGVVSRAFAFPDRGQQIWTPLAMPPAVEGGAMGLFSAMARLKPGVTAQRAAQEAETWAARAPKPGPVELAVFGARGAPRISAAPFLDAMTAEARPALLLLLSAAVLLLVAATANVAGLQLAAATVRRRELALRAAIGAGRGRLARLVLSESVLLSAAGGVAGLAIATATKHVVLALLPAGFPRLDDIAVDLRVAAFAFGLSFASAAGIGLLPAFMAGRLHLMAILAEDGGSAAGVGRRSVRMRSAILAGQVTVASVLLLSGMQLGRSFFAQLSADRGYVPGGLIVVDLQMPDGLYTPERREALVNTLLDRARAHPGVIQAGIGNLHPLSRNEAMGAFPLRPSGDGREQMEIQASMRSVSPGYLEALGRRPIAGRFLEAQDSAAARPAIVVNRTFADRYLDEPVVGSVIGNFGDLPDQEVVGVVEDARPARLASPVQPEVLRVIPLLEGLRYRHLALLVRSHGDPETLIPTLRDLLRELEPALATSSIRSMNELLADGLAQPRLYFALVGAFSACALLIVGMGLFGVLSYTVTQRRREIGVRVALGAKPADVVRLVGRRGLALAGVGVILGLALFSAGGHALAQFLYGVRPLDAVSVLGLTSALIVVAVLASILPAWQAVRVDPQQALRDG